MKISKNVQKYTFRFLVINVVYFIIKLTVINETEGYPFIHAPSIFYYLSAFFQFIFTWEINDWLIRRHLKSKEDSRLNFANSLKILGITLILFLPVSAIIYYLAIFELNHICQIYAMDLGLQFRIDFLRAALLGISVACFNLFYHSSKQKAELEHKMEELQKEIMTSKYKSLKNQISPHFLFNSLNTLTSLMYEDRDLASDFVSRLASSYRYILDNREEDLVSLEKELAFLDSFIFMMNVRHKDSLKITTDISIRPENFYIPTLSVQMLVENALKHNYYSKEKPLQIDIFSIEEDKIVVKNSLRERKLKEESTKLGILNIKNRYAYYTPKPVIVDKTEEYFTVTLPLLSKSTKELPVLSAS